MAMSKSVDAMALKFNLVTGANASTNMAVSGIATEDTIICCVESATATAALTDRTTTTSITSAGNIQCSAATNSDLLFLLWHDASIAGIDAICLKSAVVGGDDANIDMAITGIKTEDTLIAVLQATQTTGILVDRTATSSITSDGNIQSTTAFDNTTSDLAWVIYHDASAAGVEAPNVKASILAGSATTSTFTGAATSDTLWSVIEFSNTDYIPTDRTSTSSISAADTLLNGVSTNTDVLLVFWHDASL